MAEGILQSKVDSEKVFVDSAGTGGYHVGNPPDTRSIAVARKFGLNIEKQRCRKLSRADLGKFDVIYAMDKSNYRNILALANSPVEAAKVKMLLEAANLPTKEVPDPYWDDDGFEKVYHLIDAACTVIAKKIISEHTY